MEKCKCFGGHDVPLDDNGKGTCHCGESVRKDGAEITLQSLVNMYVTGCVDERVEHLELESFWPNLGDSIEDKVDGVLAVIDTLDGTASVLEEQAKVYRARAQSQCKRVEWLEDYLAENIERLGGEVKTSKHPAGVRVRLNPPSVRVENETAFVSSYPDLAKFQPPKLDKVELKRRMNEGEMFDGACLVRTKKVVR